MDTSNEIGTDGSLGQPKTNSGLNLNIKTQNSNSLRAPYPSKSPSLTWLLAFTTFDEEEEGELVENKAGKVVPVRRRRSCRKKREISEGDFKDQKRRRF
ncbi:unnamed protein product, partial [Ilex paraguariensis]